MKTTFITIALFLVAIIESAAQYHTDPESIFKMQLFLEKRNATLRDGDSSIVKGDSLYRAFADKTRLVLEALAVTDEYKLDLFPHDFRFYRMHLDSVRIAQSDNSEDQYIGLPSGKFAEYILAIDLMTGHSFRLGGFDQNDLHGFFDAIGEAHESNSDTRFSRKQFLRNYHVTGVDFNCLYKGLKQRKRDTKKFPCLRRVSDPVVTY